MASTVSTFNKSYLPDEFGQLLIATASKQSVALQVATVITSQSNEFRIPLISGEVTAGWYAENAEITLSDSAAGEEVVRPRKIAGLTKISAELANDSSPQAAQVTGESVGRSISASIDSAFFGSATGSGTPPKGLGAFADSAVTLITAPTEWADIDPFIQAIFGIEAIGGNLTSFVAHPADAQILASLKKQSGSNEPLLAPDATSPTTRRLAGLPLYTSTAVTQGTIYGIDATRTFVIIREDVTVEVDRSVYFGSDSVAVRGIARIGFGYPHSAAIARIMLAAA
jgi:HK97 family phage major capsid protein